MSKKVKLGIIGMSEGNGHPYSWSAIINGYNTQYMQKCPFPAIPAYLSAQKYPDDFIDNAEVTHIWTQERDLSEHIAKASNITYVVDDIADFIGEVDGVLLARDDAENHFALAQKIIEAGLPIYIDKPIAHSVKEATQLFTLQKYDWQIFTCTALRYGQEFQLDNEERQNIGNILAIDAYTPKSWKKYAIHIIEPVLHVLGAKLAIDNYSFRVNGSVKRLWLQLEDKVLLNFSTLGDISHPISISIIGDKGFKNIVFKNSFFAFREALKAFIQSIQEERIQIARGATLDVIKIIELGS